MRNVRTKLEERAGELIESRKILNLTAREGQFGFAFLSFQHLLRSKTPVAVLITSIKSDQPGKGSIKYLPTFMLNMRGTVDTSKALGKDVHAILNDWRNAMEADDAVFQFSPNLEMELDHGNLRGFSVNVKLNPGPYGAPGVGEGRRP